MPYTIIKSKQGPVVGFRVRKKARDSNGRFKYFSKHPLSLRMAERQRKALYVSERKR